MARSDQPSYSDDHQQPPAKKRRRDDDSHPPSEAEKPMSSYDNDGSYQSDPRPFRRPKPPSQSAGPYLKASTHSKKERKTNPSTRIHSLKKLLTSDILPPEQHRDKERELSGLLFDQQKDKFAKLRTQMIKRYHMVRFFERKKAERKLKKLQKEEEEFGKVTADPEDLGDLTEPALQQRLRKLRRDIHEAEVDVSYTMYSPLAEKYTSIFAEGKKDDQSKKRQKPKDKESKEVRSECSKPPLWHEVEKCIEGDNEKATKRRLEVLRDRKPAVLVNHAVKSNVEDSKSTGQKRVSTHSKDRGQSDPADEDSKSEDASDGGFFE